MQPQDMQAAYTSTNVTLTTTTENVAVSSPLSRGYRNSAVVVVIGYAEVTLGTGTTAITPRIRRGTAITDTLVTEANALQIQTAAASSEHYSMTAMEQVTGEFCTAYSFTLQQTAASANGTVLAAGICVIVI